MFLNLLLLAGCSSGQSESFTVSEIKDKGDGFYVLKEDKCYPLSQTEEFSLSLFKDEEILPTTFLLAGESLENLPQLGEGDSLILKTGEVIESPVYLAPLLDTGYTVGITLEPGQEGLKLKETGGIVSGSEADRMLSEIRGIKRERLLNIGGNILSYDSLNSVGCITGLTQGAEYDLEFFRGTIEEAVTLPADTLMLELSPENLERRDNLTYTKDNYAVISGLKKGYNLVVMPEKTRLLGGIFYVTD